MYIGKELLGYIVTLDFTFEGLPDSIKVVIPSYIPTTPILVIVFLIIAILESGLP